MSAEDCAHMLTHRRACRVCLRDARERAEKAEADAGYAHAAEAAAVGRLDTANARAEKAEAVVEAAREWVRSAEDLREALRALDTTTAEGCICGRRGIEPHRPGCSLWRDTTTAEEPSTLDDKAPKK